MGLEYGNLRKLSSRPGPLTHGNVGASVGTVSRTFWMYGKVCLGASVVVAYANDGYLRGAYR
jgi:hypothetical protein